MKVIKVFFSGMWSNFDLDSFWLKYFLIQEFDLYIESTTQVEDCDLVIFSVFGSSYQTNSLIDICKKQNKKTVLISLENFDRFFWIKPLIHRFDLSLGLNTISDINNYLRVPYYVWANYEQFYSNIKLSKYKNKNLCLVADNAKKFRIHFINSIRKLSLQIDCFGKISGRMIPDGYLGKLNTISEYYFNFCPENTYADGYITEKIYQSLYAGCIPIYWGNIVCDTDFFNMEKVLLINEELSNINEIIDKYSYLINHEDELKYMSNFEPFTKNHEDILSTKVDLLKSYFQKYLNI